MLKKKICNFRPFLIIAIAMIVSIVLAVFVIENQPVRIVIFACLLLISVVLLILFFIKKTKIFIFLTTLLIFVATPFILISFQSFKLDQNKKYENSEVLILGKICDYYKITTKGYLELVLDDIKISHGDIVDNLDGKVLLYSNPEYIDISTLSIGKYVFAKIELKFNQISSKDQWELFDISENIVASGFTPYYNVKIYSEKDDSFASLVKSKVYDTLQDSKMKQYDIAYAMIFGDSKIVDTDVKKIYQGTGIAHLLAVSGLHVSAIVFAISFILKKMKVSQKIQIILFAVLLSLYCYLCGFSISVIRASLMALLLNYSYIRGKPYDRLSVLAMIASIILIVSPMQLFNLSFILSFLAVLSIILLANPIARLFKKIFYDKFSNTIGILFSTQIGLAVVNIFYFNTFQPLSFVANLISIPLSSFAFILIIGAVIISMISPIFNFLCVWMGEIFSIVSQFNNYITSLNLSVTALDIPVFLIPIVFLSIFMISDYCFISKRTKIITSLGLGLCIIVLFFV